MSELRLHPRIPSALMVEISNSAGEMRPANILNLSPGGLMLLGDPALKELIFKGLDIDKDPLYHPVEAQVRIRLPNQPQLFCSRVRLLYCRRLSQFEFNLGFRYVDIAADHARMMESHVLGDSETKVALNRAFASL